MNDEVNTPLDAIDRPTTDELIDMIDPLILAGRMTGKIIIDGILVFQTMQQNRTDEELVLYDEHGFSEKMSPFGFVRIKEVDDRIRKWLSEPDETMKPLVAREQSVWYGFMIPERYEAGAYTDEMRHNFVANHSSIWSVWLVGSKLHKVNFCTYNDLYVNVATGETANVLTRERLKERVDGKKVWIRNPKYRGDSIPNHEYIGYGNYSNPEHPQWWEKFGNHITKFLLDGMDKRLAYYLKRKEDEENGVIRPQPGPTIG